MAMWMGLHAFKPDWLGGYSSLPRRFLRLSHIAFMALSLTNILYGICIDSINLPEKLKKLGSYSMIMAAITMPIICLFSIYDSFFQNLFFIPALTFTCAVFIMAFGYIKRTD